MMGYSERRSLGGRILVLTAGIIAIVALPTLLFSGSAGSIDSLSRGALYTLIDYRAVVSRMETAIVGVVSPQVFYACMVLISCLIISMVIRRPFAN